MQTPRKVPYIGPRSRRLDEISGLNPYGVHHPRRSIYRVLQTLATILHHNVVIALGITYRILPLSLRSLMKCLGLNFSIILPS